MFMIRPIAGVAAGKRARSRNEIGSDAKGCVETLNTDRPTQLIYIIHVPTIKYILIERILVSGTHMG